MKPLLHDISNSPVQVPGEISTSVGSAQTMYGMCDSGGTAEWGVSLSAFAQSPPTMRGCISFDQWDVFSFTHQQKGQSLQQLGPAPLPLETEFPFTVTSTLGLNQPLNLSLPCKARNAQYVETHLLPTNLLPLPPPYIAKQLTPQPPCCPVVLQSSCLGSPSPLSSQLRSQRGYSIVLLMKETLVSLSSSLQIAKPSSEVYRITEFETTMLLCDPWMFTPSAHVPSAYNLLKRKFPDFGRFFGVSATKTTVCVEKARTSTSSTVACSMPLQPLAVQKFAERLKRPVVLQ